MPTSKHPAPNLMDEPYAKPFWDATRNEQLLLQFCTTCETYQFFPRPTCQTCGQDDLSWKEARGSGTLHSYTIVRRTIKNPEFEPDLPYSLGLIDLPEGPRVYSRLIKCKPEDLTVGKRVQVEFDHRTEKVTIPVFSLPSIG